MKKTLPILATVITTSVQERPPYHEAEPLRQHFQAELGNEIFTEFIFRESDLRGIACFPQGGLTGNDKRATEP